MSFDAIPTDNSLNYVSNSLSYGGGKITDSSYNLPRFDREASYFRLDAPNIQGYQQVSAPYHICDEGTYHICVLDASDILITGGPKVIEL